MINNGTTRRARGWGSSAGLAGVVLLTAAAIGVGGARIEGPAPVVPRAAATDLLAASAGLWPLAGDMLNGTIKNYTDATQVLSQVDTSEFPNFAPFVGSQIATQGTTTIFLNQLQPLEDAIIAHAGKSEFLYNAVITLYNLGWYLESSNLLSLSHIVSTSVANNIPGLVGFANMGLSALDWSSFGKALLAFVVSFATNLSSISPPSPPAAGLPIGVDDSATALPAAADDPAAALPAAATTTNFFEEFVTNHMNPDAFINGLPADPGNAFEAVDNLLQNTVFATDLNDVALIPWL